MGKLSKIIAVTMIGILTMLTLVSCGSKDEDALTAAMKATKEVNSLETEYKFDFVGKFSLDGSKSSDYKTQFIVNATMFKEPMRAKIGLTMDLGSIVTRMQAFVDQENGKDMFYAGMENMGWMKTEIAVNEDDKEVKKIQQQLNKIDAGLFLSESYQYEAGEDVEENEKTYEVYHSKVTKERLISVIESISGMIEEEIRDEDRKEMNEMLGDIPFSIWIDKEEKVLYRVNISLTELAGKLSETQGIKWKEEATNPEISKFDITCTYTNYNNATDFEIPKEALEAEESKEDDGAYGMGSMFSLIVGQALGGYGLSGLQ